MNDSDKNFIEHNNEPIEIMLKNLSKESIEPPKELLETTIKKCKASREKENYTIIILIVLCSILSTLSLVITFFKLSLIMKGLAVSIWAILNNGLAFILFYNRKTLFKESLKQKGAEI